VSPTGLLAAPGSAEIHLVPKKAQKQGEKRNKKACNRVKYVFSGCIYTVKAYSTIT